MARQAVFVEVEVDTETGQVEVTKLVHPYDVGQSINPDVNDQQLIGGAYAGLGCLRYRSDILRSEDRS